MLISLIPLGIMLPVNPKEVKIPVSNELQLRKLAALIDSNVEYEKSLVSILIINTLSIQFNS